MAVPARRLIVNPDETELVLFDDYPENSQAFVVYLALAGMQPLLKLAPAPPPVGKEFAFLTGQLCKDVLPPTEAHGIGYRSYASLNSDGDRCGANLPPPAVLPFSGCACSSTKPCPDKSTCTSSGYCANLCTRDSHCAKGCDLTTNRCK
jgi:hypothetical protein